MTKEELCDEVSRVLGLPCRIDSTSRMQEILVLSSPTGIDIFAFEVEIRNHGHRVLVGGDWCLMGVKQRSLEDALDVHL